MLLSAPKCTMLARIKLRSNTFNSTSGGMALAALVS
jgi:hypothetical protein